MINWLIFIANCRWTFQEQPRLLYVIFFDLVIDALSLHGQWSLIYCNISSEKFYHSSVNSSRGKFIKLLWNHHLESLSISVFASWFACDTFNHLMPFLFSAFATIAYRRLFISPFCFLFLVLFLSWSFSSQKMTTSNAKQDLQTKTCPLVFFFLFVFVIQVFVSAMSGYFGNLDINSWQLAYRYWYRSLS